MSQYIKDHKEDWANEFAYELEIEQKPEHEKIVSMACYTILNHIADNFRDGELREEILKFADRSGLDFVTVIPEDDNENN